MQRKRYDIQYEIQIYDVLIFIILNYDVAIIFLKYFSEHIFGLRLLIIWITKVSLPNTFVILCSILLMFYDCQLIFVVAVYWDVMLTNENFCLHYVNECIYRIMFHVWFCHRESGYIWDHTLVKWPVYM